MVIACISSIVLCWGAGIWLIAKAMGHEAPERFEPLAPCHDSVTINSDLEGLA